MMNNFSIVLAAAALAGTTNAFWGTGHLLGKSICPFFLQLELLNYRSIGCSFLPICPHQHSILTEFLFFVLVSRRAQAILESEASDAFDSALTVLSFLADSEPSLTSDEDDHPFTECATFADDIKGKGYSF